MNVYLFAALALAGSGSFASGISAAAPNEPVIPTPASGEILVKAPSKLPAKLKPLARVQPLQVGYVNRLGTVQVVSLVEIDRRFECLQDA